MPELVTFAARDGWPLEGLFYPDGSAQGAVAALLVHGKVMNFYVGPSRLLPPHLAALGCACLAMNRRGHDLGGIRGSRESYGGAWERFADSQSDIAGGVAELERRGFERIVLIGHSFGGIAAAAYSAANPRQIAALAPAQAVAAAAGPRATLAIVPGADHFYNGVEAALIGSVCDWYSATVAGSRPAR